MGRLQRHRLLLAICGALYAAAFVAGVGILGRYGDRAADVVVIGTVLGMTAAVPHFISRGRRAARYEPVPRDSGHVFLASICLLAAGIAAMVLLAVSGVSHLYGAAVLELIVLGAAGFALLEYLSRYTERKARVSPQPAERKS